MKTALIIGITGQDGSYIASHLLHHGFKVCGTTRHAKPKAPHNHSLLTIGDLVSIYELDITDSRQTSQLLDCIRPDIIFHLGGLTSVSLSFSDPIETFTSICHSTLNILECVRLNHRHARVFIPCSSDCFGGQTSYGQPATEQTEFKPCSPYALAKSTAYDLAHFYRRHYGLFVSVGILSNHESPLRGPNFVTSKLVRSIHSILNGNSSIVKLGNISVVRDWCWAPDVTMGIIKLMEMQTPETLILASGKSASLEELISIMFLKSGLGDYRPYVSCSNDLIRSSEVSSIFLSPTKASEVIPWTHTTTLEQIAEKLIDQVLF